MASSTVAAISIPTYDKMMWPMLLALQELGGSGNVVELNDKAIELAGYTEDQQAILHGTGPQTEIRYRLAWARTYLRVVGAVENSSRGVWAITEYGRSLQEFDMPQIPPQVRVIQRAGQTPPEETAAAETELGPPDASELDGSTFRSTVLEEWRDRLLSVLQSMPPSAFERLSQRLLRESGFTQVQVTGRSGDGGIDGIGVLRIALLSFQVFFQCKRYKGSVGASAIRDFRGAMVGRTDKGLLITTGTFTPDAKKEATRDGAPVLDLIDGDQLCVLLKDRGLGVTTRQVEEVAIEPDWFDRL
jgi:restriction system protein